MSLTLGSGPLGGHSGDANYTFQSPAHKILFQPDGRRLRAIVGDTVVLDTTGAHLLHETGIGPVAYIPLADIDADLLERTATTTHCPFKGDASYWSLRVGDDVREDAVWAYEEPLARAPWLRGFAALYPDRVDRWLVEDEPLHGHLRDPYHRVDVHQSSRAVRVSVGDDLVAETVHPVLRSRRACPCAPTSRDATSSPATSRRARRGRPARTRATRRTGTSSPAARSSPTPRGATSCRSPPR